MPKHCAGADLSMRYRLSETNFQYGYRHKCIYGCLLTANKVFLFFVFLHKSIYIGAAC